MAAKVLLLVEHEDGTVRDVTYELVTTAHRVAEQRGWDPSGIKAALLGHDAEPLAQQVAARGVAEVVYVDGPALAHYTSEGYARALEAVIAEETPELVLFAATPRGWDVAPVVAGGLDVPLATACSAIRFEDGRAIFTRKAFNGKFVHEVSIENATPLMATMDKGAAPAYEGTTSGAVRRIDAPVAPDELRTRFVEIKTGPTGGVDLTAAPVIVAAGRGVGGPDKLDVVRELAQALGGQLGASRAVTDAGWLPHEHQIGSSGVTVSPKLYVACGISGAIQHVVGMKGSGYIVAINKDPDAPIFSVADVGIVGDLFEYVPAITKAVKEAKGG